MALSFDDIHTVGVVGSGIMGAGIAQVLLTAGYDVILNDQRADALAKAADDIAARLDRLAEKGQLTVDAATAAKGRLRTTETLADMAPAQVVIEAIIERLDIKQSLFQQLEGILAPDAVLASNTSSLSIAAIGKTCTQRERVCGLHFFNPVPLMKLVEVIPGPFTTDAVTELMVKLVKRMDKVSVIAKDGPGFLVNLGGRAYYTEALHIEQEGVASAEQIDRIMTKSVGFRMGPFELMDLTGIDVNFPVTTFIHQGHQYDPRLKTAPRHERLFEAGRYGRKVGIGFYDYTDKVASPAPSEKPAGDPAPRFEAVIPAAHPGFAALAANHGLSETDAADTPILVSPFGEDASSVAYRLSVDPARLVAIDFTGLDKGVLTLMTPPVASKALDKVADWLRAAGFDVEIVKDSPGFVAQRILAMIVNLCCEMAQTGVGSPQDIETAMKLGLNYPFGPLGFGDRIGPANIFETMRNLQEVTGSDRYRSSFWLRRRAQLGLSLAAD